MTSVIPPPISDPIARPKRPNFKDGRDPQEGLVGKVWGEYFLQTAQASEAVPARAGTSIVITSQSAAVSPTDFSGGSLRAGLYRINYYARITTAASVSSSLTVTFDWTDGGVACSFSGAAMTGNTTSTVQSGVYVIRIDGLSPVRYSTAYVSNAAGEMRYSLSVVLEALPS